MCARGPQDRALSITIEPSGKALGLCHRCGWKFVRDDRGSTATDAPGGNEPPRPVSKAPDVARRVQSILAASKPPRPGGPVDRYLRSRGLETPSTPDLREHVGLRHAPSGRVFPCMVARISEIGDPSRTLGTHRTYLTAGGAKAAVDPARMNLGSKQGGAIRLCADEDVELALAIGEGIETTIALAQITGVPAWALIDASNLAQFPALPGLSALHVAVDHDEAGHRAFDQLAARYQAAGVEVIEYQAQAVGADINDVLQVAS